MSRKKRAVTIQDVAKTAGVSVSTVSRVLNGKVDVASETQVRILGVIDELNYMSNLAARSMRSHRTHLIGLIMPDIAFPFAVEVMKGVNRAITESDYDLLVYTTGDVKKYGTASHEKKYVNLLNNSLTDGVVVAAPATADFSTDAPIVVIDPYMSNPDYPAVHATNYAGALDAMHYLLSLGHRRIGFITGRADLESSARRLRGYRDALEQAGIPIDEALISAGDYTGETAIKCTHELISLNHPPTAIFASNDQTAIGVLQTANAMGVKVPDDLSLMGFDNISEAGYLNLTTVDQFIGEMGFVATKMLFQLINGDVLEERTYKMQTHLVERGSCRKI
jgi:LacI family transcriptional regulator